jgi:hypothetical protein
VTVWESWGQDAPGQAGYGVVARIWSGDGTPLTGEIAVNTTAADYQWYAAVTDLGPDRFVVAWCSWAQDGDGGGIYQRIFDSAGQPITGELPVNMTFANYQWLPRLARSGDRFAAVWSSWKQDGSREGVCLRLFDRDGRALSLEEQVNVTTESFQWEPDIAWGSGGDFIVVWSTWGNVGKDYEVAARRFTVPATQGVLRPSVIQHPFWRSTTRLALHVFDSTAMDGDLYEAFFDSLAGRKATVTVRNVTRGDTLVREYPIDRGENVFYRTPAFDGLALEIIPEFDLDLDFRSSFFANHSGSNLAFVLTYPGAGSKKLAPIDLVLSWGPTDTLGDGRYVSPLDTAINTGGNRVVAVPFLAWNLSDNEKCDLLVAEARVNQRWDPGERIVLRTPVAYRTAANNTCAELSQVLPSGPLQLPAPGDSNFIFTTRPIRQGELFTFTAERSQILDVPPASAAAVFALFRNYPNPFNPVTTIRYTLPVGGKVTLSVYNVLGQRVAVLVDEVQQAGHYRAKFDGKGFASGPYFCRLEQGGASIVQKMLLLK